MSPTARWTVSGGPGYKVAERAADTVARYRMFSGGEKVVVGVSGGPDSVCLLDVLARLRAGLTLVVAHVDHGLAPDSERISKEVARAAAAAGFDVHVARAAGLGGPNLHERARDFRYSFFQSIASQEGATLVATGHTLDDRVETTLARFIHGAGTEGLAGLPPIHGTRVRPLIELRRSETRTYCTEAGLPFVDDPANLDHRFDRPSIRDLLIARIEGRWGPGSIHAMAGSIEKIREDAQALAAQTDLIYEGLTRTDPDGSTTLTLADVMLLPRALRRRVLERAIGRIRDRGAAIDEVLDALEREDRKPDARFDVAGGTIVTIGRDRIVVTAPSEGAI
ncbi:MAG: tRNA lysidine(34) synthetase TilS [Actinomycetota bacterium]